MQNLHEHVFHKSATKCLARHNYDMTTERHSQYSAVQNMIPGYMVKYAIQHYLKHTYQDVKAAYKK